MNYNGHNKLQNYSSALDSLMALEKRIDYQLKYVAFVDEYANWSEFEIEQYNAVFFNHIKHWFGYK